MSDRSWWSVVGASVQGTAHRRSHRPCQDAHAYRVLPQGQLIITVADGAGSAAQAEAAARLAASQAATRLEIGVTQVRPRDEASWRQLLQIVFQDTYQCIAQQAEHCAAALHDFATTLTCVVVADPWLVIGQIGDGIAVIDDGAGELALPIVPQRGEYANETNFLLSVAAAEDAELFVAQRQVQALALSTDGLLRLALTYPTYQPFVPFFRPLFALLAEEPTELAGAFAAWLASEPVCARTDDDTTLVVAVRTGDSTVATLGS